MSDSSQKYSYLNFNCPSLSGVYKAGAFDDLFVFFSKALRYRWHEPTAEPMRMYDDAVWLHMRPCYKLIRPMVELWDTCSSGIADALLECEYTKQLREKPDMSDVEQMELAITKVLFTAFFAFIDADDKSLNDFYCWFYDLAKGFCTHEVMVEVESNLKTMPRKSRAKRCECGRVLWH